MDFDVYCDESHPDVFSSTNTNCKNLVIGSLWLPTEARQEMKNSIHQLRDRHKIGGEFKWHKVTQSSYEFYNELVDWYLSLTLRLRFRCIVVDSSKVNLELHHENDQELGFYKFYYQLLHHWILDFNNYSIFCDLKTNHDPNRLKILQQCLDKSNLTSTIEKVQAVRSRESVLTQLSDLLTGMASARLNGTLNENSPKYNLVTEFEKKLGRKISHTYRSEQKFNVFVIDLAGGW